jgi:hypothetical protein
MPTSPPVSLFSRLWIIIPVGALGFLIWVNHARMQRVQFVSNLPGRAESVDVPDPASPTGYAHGQRELVVPERAENSLHWIAQTQQMFAQREWRVRRVDYDNAPLGRDVSSASPYRWWLGLVAWTDHMLSGRPIGLSVERAALWAEPVLHGLLLLGLTIFVAWRSGAFAAALLATGLVAIFPFAAGFLPGVPDDHGLATTCVIGSIFALLAGMKALRPGGDQRAVGSASRPARRWFALAGLVGGLGMWINVSTQTPILAGILLGAPLAAWIVRRSGAGNPSEVPVAPPWRLWAFSGATAILVGYLIEFFPSHLGSWQLNAVHPLYGLAWIGAGELLARAVNLIQRSENPFRRIPDLLAIALAAAAIAAVPVVMKLTESRGFLAADLSSFRLSGQPHGVVASSLWAWLVHDGITARVWATFLPVILVFPVLWLILRKKTEMTARASLALALGPVVVAFGFACSRLSWWGVFDGTLLVLMASAVPAHLAVSRRSARWMWTGLAALLMIPGVVQLWPQRITKEEDYLTSAEAEMLIERNLAHWLARHAGEEGAIVFAPPRQSASLSFFGGLGSIGTFSPDNHDGLRGTVMIASVTSLPEAQILIQARRIRYILLPSWDSFFDEFARLYLVEAQASRKSILISELRRLVLPVWLRPVPCQILKIGGYEGQSVLVFEVVDDQSPAVAMSRSAEYLVETGELEKAAAAAEALRRFPGDLGALTARVQVQSARGDAAGSAQTLDSLLSRLSSGADRFLPWDRRVSLATVLARAGRVDLAREQVRRCLVEVSDQKLRSLSTGSLYNLLVLSHSFGLEATDPRLRELALNLLPGALRSSL